MATIRKNNLNKIRAMLNSAVLITCYHDDGTDATSERATVEQVMALADRFSSVTTEHVTIYQCYFFTVYQTVAEAQRRLTDRAFAKYFPETQVAA